MSLSTAELEDLLRLALSALRVQAGPGATAIQGPALAQGVEQPVRTLNDWLDVREKALADGTRKVNTIKNRRANIKHVRQLWGHRPLTQIRPPEIASVMKKLAAEKKTSMAGRILFEVKDAFTEAIAEGWVESSPAKDIKAPRHKIVRARLRVETWQSMRVLASAGPQRWVEPMLLLALVTAQRRADLAKMGEGDIVAEGGLDYLRVEQQKEAGKGYGARVEIPLDLRMEAIGLSVRDVIEICRASAKPGPTFLRKANGKPIEQSSLSARFHEHIVSVLGEGAHQQYEWPSLHEVRSLSARLYKAQGFKDVQTLLGHANAEMTIVYENDRGLSAKEWKRVALPAAGERVERPA